MADEFDPRHPPGYKEPETDVPYQEPRYSNEPAPAEADSSSGWAWGALLLLLLLVGIAFWGYGRSGRGGGTAQNTTPPAATAAKTLEGMQGKSMSLSGDIKDMMGRNAFLLSSDNLDGKQVLVISRQPTNELPINVSAGEARKVEVQGKVEKFDREKIEQELGIKFSDDQLKNWDGKNVLVADTIKSKSGAELERPTTTEAR